VPSDGIRRWSGAVVDELSGCPDAAYFSRGSGEVLRRKVRAKSITTVLVFDGGPTENRIPCRGRESSRVVCLIASAPGNLGCFLPRRIVCQTRNRETALESALVRRETPPPPRHIPAGSRPEDSGLLVNSILNGVRYSRSGLPTEIRRSLLVLRRGPVPADDAPKR